MELLVAVNNAKIVPCCPIYNVPQAASIIERRPDIPLSHTFLNCELRSLYNCLIETTKSRMAQPTGKIKLVWFEHGLMRGREVQRLCGDGFEIDFRTNLNLSQIHNFFLYSTINRETCNLNLEILLNAVHWQHLAMTFVVGPLIVSFVPCTKYCFPHGDA